jgi:hypothetical protein
LSIGFTHPSIAIPCHKSWARESVAASLFLDGGWREGASFSEPARNLTAKGEPSEP